MAYSVTVPTGAAPSLSAGRDRLTHPLILLLFGAAIFLGCIVSPPSLMDDVDAVQAQIPRNMLESGDWVTAHIDGVKYLEKSPLGFWQMAVSYSIFGVHDWAARIPTALGCIGLMWITHLFGCWAFGRRAGFYSGLSVGACVGLFLFTRIVIPDVWVTLAITTALYCFARAVEEEEGKWAYPWWFCIGAGLLLKGLIAAVFPIAIALLYLAFTRQLFLRSTWRSLHPLAGSLIALALYVPWLALATYRNPPYFDFTMHSDPGVYRGFFWFYFINEHVLRFLNLRYPRDYNTVPRIPFIVLHLVWLFPWSVFLPAALRAWRPRLQDRANSVRLLAILWIVFVLGFFSLSTTQEYYSMPCYAAFALLIGPVLAERPTKWISAGYAALAAAGAAGATVAAWILFSIRGVRAVGDISNALAQQNAEAYTLSMGHLGDLTLGSFAYLRGPLILATAALLIGSAAAWFTRRGAWAPLCLAGMMTVSIHAARAAMTVFDPYLSSRPLAEILNHAPDGQLIIEGHYYPASSVPFYTGKPALLYHGRVDNMVYGSAAPGCPPVFLEDAGLAALWKENKRVYLIAPVTSRRQIERVVSPGAVYVFAESGGKYILTNVPAPDLPVTGLLPRSA